MAYTDPILANDLAERLQELGPFTRGRMLACIIANALRCMRRILDVKPEFATTSPALGWHPIVCCVSRPDALTMLLAYGSNVDEPVNSQGSTLLDVYDHMVRGPTVIDHPPWRTAAILIDHGARVLPTHSICILTHHATLQAARYARKRAAICLLTLAMPRDLTRDATRLAQIKQNGGSR